MNDLKLHFLAADKHATEALAMLKTYATKFIKSEVEAHGGEIRFHNSKDWFGISYDGGNHPEYYATPCSTVHSVFMKEDKLFVELEDCDEYPIDNVPVLDLADIALHL